MVGITLELRNWTARFGHRLRNVGGEGGWVKLQTIRAPHPIDQSMAGGRLEKNRHRQPEGIAVAPDLTLLISGEAGRDAAAITAYA